MFLPMVASQRSKVKYGRCYSSFAAEGATGGTDYAGQAMDALLTQANDLIGKVWPVVVAVVGAGLAIRIFKKFSSKAV